MMNQLYNQTDKRKVVKCDISILNPIYKDSCLCLGYKVNRIDSKI